MILDARWDIPPRESCSNFTDLYMYSLNNLLCIAFSSQLYLSLSKNKAPSDYDCVWCLKYSTCERGRRNGGCSFSIYSTVV